MSGSTLRGVRVVLGAVSPTPWQVDAANAFLEGKSYSVETAEKAAELILKDARPFGDNAYKIPIAKALIRRTLQQLVA
jgi:xanthine dehydrogenase YagS FAD-binding subunit